MVNVVVGVCFMVFLVVWRCLLCLVLNLIVFWFKENWVSAAFIYFSVYIHPLVLILASRFFWLCYRWRIPMIIYLFGINAIHIVYWNVFTTNEMVEANAVILVMTIIFYVYGFADKYFSGKGCQSLISRL
jgi:hypothetical protein